MAGVDLSELKDGIRDILAAMTPSVGVVYAHIPDIHNYDLFLEVFATDPSQTILIVEGKRADVTWGDATPRSAFQKNYQLSIQIIRLDEEGEAYLASFEALVDRVLDHLNQEEYTEAGLVGAEGIRLGTWGATDISEGEVNGPDGWHCYMATLQTSLENQPVDA